MKILLVLENSVKRNGCYKQLKNVLASKKVFEFSGVEPNPEIKQAEDAMFARKNKVEFIIAAGVGSVIDFIKFYL